MREPGGHGEARQGERSERPLVWYVAAGYGAAGGVEAYLFHYAVEMRRHGFDTRVVVFSPLPRAGHRYLLGLRAAGVPIDSLEDRQRLRIWFLFAAMALPWAGRAWLRARRRPDGAALFRWAAKRCAIRELRRMLGDELPDIVHVKGRLPAEAWPVFPCERTIFHVATSGRIDCSWTPVEIEAMRVFASRVAKVFAPGQGVASAFAADLGVTRNIDAIFTMAPDEAGRGPGDDAGGIESAGPACRFGTLCRFDPIKGIGHILEALIEFRNRHGAVGFVFAGEGAMEPEIRAFVDRHGLHGVRVIRVHTAADALAEFDVFVHPSLSEAMPVSLVEALMCGKPCIATRVGGIPDLVRDGVEGLLIEPGSAGPLLAAMERFAAMPSEQRRAFALRARTRYEDVCRPEKVGETVASHYREILRCDPCPSR
jgi:glycosyltransferase involved in cell wall biosynthesis